MERHRCEVRRALNDEELFTIAYNITESDVCHEWTREARKLIKWMPHLDPITAFSALANSCANVEASRNESLPEPSTTRSFKRKPEPSQIKPATKKQKSPKFSTIAINSATNIARHEEPNHSLTQNNVYESTSRQTKASTNPEASKQKRSRKSNLALRTENSNVNRVVKRVPVSTCTQKIELPSSVNQCISQKFFVTPQSSSQIQISSSSKVQASTVEAAKSDTHTTSTPSTSSCASITLTTTPTPSIVSTSITTSGTTSTSVVIPATRVFLIQNNGTTSFVNGPTVKKVFPSTVKIISGHLVKDKPNNVLVSTATTIGVQAMISPSGQRSFSVVAPTINTSAGPRGVTQTTISKSFITKQALHSPVVYVPTSKCIPITPVKMVQSPIQKSNQINQINTPNPTLVASSKLILENGNIEVGSGIKMVVLKSPKTYSFANIPTTSTNALNTVASKPGEPSASKESAVKETKDIEFINISDSDSLSSEATNKLNLS